MEIRERDYLMRQFNQLAKVLASLMGFKEEGEHEKSISFIEDSYKEILGLDLPALNAMSPSDLLSYLLEKQSMNLPTLEKMGEVLREEAYIYRSGGIVDLFISRAEKATYLLNYVHQNDKTFSMTRKALIESLIRDIEITNNPK